ncbi:MAG: hypothetical protein IPG71_01345 [bacterium]|nr:hypothetical protein [bacterium]
MKRSLLLLCLLCCVQALSALTLTQAEYFLNTDPGLRNGIAIPISPGDDVSITLLMIPSTMLDSNASHDVFIRYRADDGLWSNTERRHFFAHFPIASGYAGRDITAVEYWFDDQSPIFVETDDDPTMTWAALIPTSGLTTNRAHKFSTRFFGSHGQVGAVESRYFFIHEPIPGIWYSRDVTHVEYQFDSNPPVLIDLVNSQEIDWISLLPTTGLQVNMQHKLTVRYFDEDGKWSNPEARYFFAIQSQSGTVEYFEITHVEYSYDDVNPMLVDVTDGQSVSYAALIASLGLQVNHAHKLSVRYLDSRGLWSNSEARYVFVHESPIGVVTWFDVAAVEYWIDGGAPLQVDIADAHNVSYAGLVAHNAGPGPHHFYFRYVEASGQVSNTEHLPFFVWSGAGPSSAARLAGAEYFVNADPGMGNGVQITFPQDGAWDEQDENTLTVLTGLPVGVHRFGIRFKDEVGNWSHTLADTFVVGPALVISISGNDIVLSWIANPDNIPFHIYRAPGVEGPYTEIGTSNSLSYTDTGILNTESRRVYHITTTNNGILSSFRLPETPPAQKHID